jgi:hypothetical protein
MGNIVQISHTEEATLAFTGAKQRLARAQQALADFQLEHDGFAGTRTKH